MTLRGGTKWSCLTERFQKNNNRLCPPGESNPHATGPRILSPLRLPFRQAGTARRVGRRRGAQHEPRYASLRAMSRARRSSASLASGVRNALCADSVTFSNRVNA